jgi:hypothetical protein
MDSLTENERSLVHRWKHCVGPLVYIVNKAGNQGPKQSCYLCQKQTSWPCLGCHESYCGKITLPSSDGTTMAKSFVVCTSCWLQKNIAALERHGSTILVAHILNRFKIDYSVATHFEYVAPVSPQVVLPFPFGLSFGTLEAET